MATFERNALGIIETEESGERRLYPVISFNRGNGEVGYRLHYTQDAFQKIGIELETKPDREAAENPDWLLPELSIMRTFHFAPPEQLVEEINADSAHVRAKIMNLG